MEGMLRASGVAWLRTGDAGRTDVAVEEMTWTIRCDENYTVSAARISRQPQAFGYLVRESNRCAPHGSAPARTCLNWGPLEGLHTSSCSPCLHAGVWLLHCDQAGSRATREETGGCPLGAHHSLLDHRMATPRAWLREGKCARFWEFLCVLRGAWGVAGDSG